MCSQGGHRITANGETVLFCTDSSSFMPSWHLDKPAKDSAIQKGPTSCVPFAPEWFSAVVQVDDFVSCTAFTGRDNWFNKSLAEGSTVFFRQSACSA